MASKAANTAEVTETRGEAAEAPLLDAVAIAIKKMLARGKERGYLTYDELSAALPPDQVSSEQIEDTMTMLVELGIKVIESESRGNLDDDAIGRTDDPISGVTAKGRTTVPEAVRQTLGIDGGGKIAYRIEDGQVTVYNPEAEHRTPPQPTDHDDEVTQETIDALNRSVPDDQFDDHETISGPAW
jgi:bifunctional DNA-binding transcriptional regulator/antitoxin component of YhaV-PrlF toxin-antitoxin module